MAKFNKDSVSGTVTVVVLLSLVCSIVVSGAAVALKSKQDEQKALDVQRNILTVAGLMKEDNASVIKETYNKFIEPRLVDLQSGDYVQASAEEINKFEPKDAIKDPAKSQAIPAEADKAGIKVRANQARVYLVKDEQGNVTQVVLPMYGRGLWSTMYGFVSVAPDANTIKGITYYDQGETAGLGGEIANPRWQAQFVDKKLFDEQGNQKFKIYKGSSAADKEHGVDGLSGATLTSNGVQGSFDYWFSQNGFGPFLAKFKAGEIK